MTYWMHVVGTQVYEVRLEGKVADEGSGKMRWEGGREWFNLSSLNFSILGRVALLV